MSEVADSLKSAPALSLRARAQALQLPRTTLHNIMKKDLPADSKDKKPTGYWTVHLITFLFLSYMTALYTLTVIQSHHFYPFVLVFPILFLIKYNN